MSVFARKTKPLTIIPGTQPNSTRSDFQVYSGTIRDSLRGWLDAVAPTSPPPATRLARLTPLDIVRVNHATIREGESHCIWPPSVVERFKAASVITEMKARHYELRDSNVRRLA